MRDILPNFHEEQVRTPIHFSSWKKFGKFGDKIGDFTPNRVKSSKPRGLLTFGS